LVPSIDSRLLLDRSFPPRFFSEEAKKGESATDTEEKPAAEEGSAKEEPVELSREEQLEKEVDELKKEAQHMKDQWVRSVAEQENIRAIAKRDVQAARDFAVTSFAKSLLDTADNLDRALEAVPEEMTADKEGNPVLATLYEGIQMTNTGLLKAFEKNGLVKYGEAGDSFDPNSHDALFEYVDPNQEPGTIGQVMKKGFKLNNRVIRPAEVGVVKKG
jgi:molecular chaperone GrpE